MPTKPPLIGVTMDADEKPNRCRVYSDYLVSIEKAGGIPLAIPYLLDQALIGPLLDRLDGILFTGGDDLDPALYGEAWHPQAIPVNPIRQQFELALVAEVERRRLPALGVCLGSQLMNVHRGGSLHQFLPDLPRDNAIEHRRLERDRPEHPVRLEAGSIIGQAIGQSEIIANTFHKQAVNRLGRNLHLVATAPDGVIEAFEDPVLPLFAAIQWHPERLHDRPEHLALFKLLVEKSRSGQ